jgi:methyl-accepting chemotaxis protein
MSGSEQFEHVRKTSHGVTVDKRFEEDEFPVPAIAFEIESARSETVTLELVDEVPPGVAVEDLGFHPEYGSEYWEITEDTITFEREIEPNSEYTTVYGIRATGTDNVEQFLTEPTLERVDPPLEESDDVVVDETGTDAVRDVIAGESDTVPGLEEDEGGEADEEIGTLNLADPNDEESSQAVEAGAADDEDKTVEADTLVGALAAELRNGNVDPDDVKLLREAFDVVDGPSSSVDARIKRLQTEVSDLLAYMDALEEFLDEEGTAQQLIEEFRTELEGVTSDLSEVSNLAREHETVLSEVESTMDTVEASMASLEAELEDALTDIDAVQGDVDTVQEDVQAVMGDVKDVEATVEDVEATVTDVETNVQSVEAEVEDLAGQVGNIDVEEVRADIEQIEADVQDIKDWRDQLTSVIGGN